MPRTEEQYQQIREKSKNLIIETALGLFSRNGFHSTSINQIAKEAGVATGLIYNYFSSKEELLDETIKNSLTEFTNIINSRKEVMENNNLAALVELLFETVKRKINTWRLFILIGLQPNMAGIGKKNVDYFAEHMERTFADYFGKRGVNNPELKAKVLGGLLHAAFLNYIIHEDEELFDLLKKEIIEKFVV